MLILTLFATAPVVVSKATVAKPDDDGLLHGKAEVLREFHSTRQALPGEDLHHTNRITQMPTEALSSKAPSQNALLQQIKNDVGSFFETAHP